MNSTHAVVIALVLCGCSSVSVRTGQVTPGRLQPFSQNNKFGFKDETGMVVIEPIYDDAGAFAFGLAPVLIGPGGRFDHSTVGHDRGKWGYINAEGKMIIPPSLSSAKEFSEGLALVWDEQGPRFIDTEGKTVITFGHEVVSVGSFSQGLAPVYGSRLVPQGYGTKYINKRGETVFACDGSAEEFHEGLAAFCVIPALETEPLKYGYIDLGGRVAIAPQFAETGSFSEGLAVVRTKKTTNSYGKGDTWGYIDKSGEFSLIPLYNEAHPFANGVAKVHVGGTLRFLSFHQPPIWEGGEWQLIDRKGNVLKRSEEWIQ